MYRFIGGGVKNFFSPHFEYLFVCLSLIVDLSIRYLQKRDEFAKNLKNMTSTSTL